MIQKDTISVASLNPVKINAALGGVQAAFPQKRYSATGFAAPSGVTDQPMTDRETLLGARNRLDYLIEKGPPASFWVAIEGGIEDKPELGMSAFAWIVISDGKKMGFSKSGSFFLPEQVASLVRQGIELGHANDQLFDRENSKQMGGALGILSDGVLDRTALYHHAMLLALLPFIKSNLY